MIGTFLVIALAAVGLLAAIAAILRRWLVLVTIRGASMEPALRDGDRVLVLRRSARRVRQGQVVVFADPEESAELTVRAERLRPQRWIVKRIFAAAGDPLPRVGFPALAELDLATVPPGHFVVLGDNLARSHDSREMGLLPAERLLGVMLRDRQHRKRAEVMPVIATRR
jgi:signal peptidase I